MILFHKSLKRSEDIIKSLKRYFEVNCKTICGVIETFCNINKQGYMLKVYHSYSKDNDLAIWIYESVQDRNIKVGYGTLSNVDNNNCWKDASKVNFKEYPIVSDIKRKIIQNIYNNIKDYYGLNEIIKKPTDEDGLKEILGDFKI